MVGAAIQRSSIVNRPIILAAAAIALAASGFAAEAHCGSQLSETGTRVVPKLPFLPSHDAQLPPGGATIVGLWQSVYTTSDGQLFNETFESWHSDGLEMEMVDQWGVGGNICVGTWTQTAQRTVQEFHTAWTFDNNGNLNGTLVIEATLKVASNNQTYKGNFDFKLYDLNGNLLQEVTGTEKATRISVD